MKTNSDLIIEYGNPDFQRTDAWLIERAGVLTATNSQILMTGKGIIAKPKALDGLAYRLVADILKKENGNTDSFLNGFTNEAMKNGNDLEPSACAFFEAVKNIDIKHAGFIYKDKNKRVGFSPDGLIIKNGEIVGGLEIKCPSDFMHIDYVINNQMPAKYFHQVQFQMWVLGLKKWSFVSYNPSFEKNLIIEVDADTQYQENLTIVVNNLLPKIDYAYNFMTNSKPKKETAVIIKSGDEIEF